MKKVFLLLLLLFIISCAQKNGNGHVLVDAKMYMHGITYNFNSAICSSSNSGGLIISLQAGDHLPSIAIDTYSNQPGTYQIWSSNTPGCAFFNAYWNTELNQEMFQDHPIVAPNDSNTVTIDHCSPFKVSGSFHTYIDSVHWSNLSGTFLATGYFNFEAQ